MKRYSAGNTFVETDYIPQQSVGSFLKLLDFVASKIGSHNLACEYCGIKGGHKYTITKGERKMTAKTAQKIMAGYKRIKAEHA